MPRAVRIGGVEQLARIGVDHDRRVGRLVRATAFARMGRMGGGMASTVEMAVMVMQAGLGLGRPQRGYHPKCSETENGMTQTARRRRLGTRHDPFPVP